MHKSTISIALLYVLLFLLIAEQVREIIFGGEVAVVMSIIAFIVSRKVPSKQCRYCFLLMADSLSSIFTRYTIPVFEGSNPGLYDDHIS